MVERKVKVLIDNQKIERKPLESERTKSSKSRSLLWSNSINPVQNKQRFEGKTVTERYRNWIANR